jgi:hypothetical protein
MDKRLFQERSHICVMEFTIKHARIGINIQDYKCYIWVSHSGEAFILWHHVLTILFHILAYGYKHFLGTYSSIFNVAGRQYISYILLVPIYQTHYITILIRTWDLHTHLKHECYRKSCVIASETCNSDSSSHDS